MPVYERKYSEDGEDVAVLYSPGYGAGWSTWDTSGNSEQMLFDKRLVEAALVGVKHIEPLAEEIFGEDTPYLSGWSSVRVCWIKEGKKFFIREYDGSESIVLEDEIGWSIA